MALLRFSGNDDQVSTLCIGKSQSEKLKKKELQFKIIVHCLLNQCQNRRMHVMVFLNARDLDKCGPITYWIICTQPNIELVRHGTEICPHRLCNNQCIA